MWSALILWVWGYRLYDQCYMHQHQFGQHRENGTYQAMWRGVIARQTAMVELMGPGGMQWLLESAHVRHLGVDTTRAVMGRVRRWIESLAACLLSKGSDMCMAPSVLQDALSTLPVFTKAALGELVDRVWLRSECENLACVPGKVLHGALLLLQLRQVKKLALWKAARGKRGSRLPTADLYWHLFDSMESFDVTGKWRSCLRHGLQFVERVLDDTVKSANNPGFLPFLYSTSGTRDKTAQLALDPLDMATLLEILVTVAASACKTVDQLLLPEGYVRLWLAPRSHLVQNLSTAQAEGKDATSASNYVERCVVASTKMMRYLQTSSWLQNSQASFNENRRRNCAPATTEAQQRSVWTHAEATLRMAVSAVVGTVNSPPQLQAKLMRELNMAYSTSQLKSLAHLGEGRSRVGWRHSGVVNLLKAMAGKEAGLKLALTDFCSSELPGPILLSKNSHSGLDRGSQQKQLALVDALSGLICLGCPSTSRQTDHGTRTQEPLQKVGCSSVVGSIALLCVFLICVWRSGAVTYFLLVSRFILTYPRLLRFGGAL